MKKSPAAVAGCCAFCFAATISGQVGGVGEAPPDRSPTAVMRFDAGTSLALRSGHGLFGRVAARTNQAIAIQLQFPADLAEQSVLVESVDGAQVIGSANNLVVNADGSATLQLRLGSAEGIYRFIVTCRDSRAVLRFHAIAPGKPSPDSTLLVPSL